MKSLVHKFIWIVILQFNLVGIIMCQVIIVVAVILMMLINFFFKKMAKRIVNIFN